MKLRRSVAAAVGASAALALALSGCSGSTGGAEGGGGTLTYQFTGVPISLNPALAGGGGSVVYTALAYDPLIYLSGDGQLEPDLATEWAFVDDTNTQLELTIRDGVTFSDGSELTAQAVVDSLEYFLQAGGGNVVQAGPIDTIEATDDDTVLITYKTPFPAGPSRLTQEYQFGLIIGPEGLADPEGLLTSMHGTGQYVYNADESVAESSYIYDRNPTYWNPDAQQYDRVEIKVIGDPNAVISAATTGQLDYAGGTPSTAETAKGAGLDIISAPYFNWGLIVLDRAGQLVPALADEKVRQAMAYAIDRSAVADARGGADYNELLGQVTAEGEGGHIADFGFDYDLDQAKALMAESGYPDGFSMTLLSETPLDNQSALTQAAIAHLGEIGIDVQLEVDAAVPSFIEKAASKQYPAVIWPLVGDNASDYANVYTGPGFTNAFGVQDAEFDALIAQAIAASGDEKASLEEQVTRRSNELAWFVPIVATLNLYYVSPKVTNVTISPRNPNPMPVGPTADLSWQPAS